MFYISLNFLNPANCAQNVNFLEALDSKTASKIDFSVWYLQIESFPQ